MGTAADGHVFNGSDWLLIGENDLQLSDAAFFKLPTHDPRQRTHTGLINICYTQSARIQFIACAHGADNGNVILLTAKNLDSGTLTPVLRRLEKAGYINRIRSKGNERKLFLSLTEEGTMLKERAKSVPAIIQECISLSEEELLLLRDMLHRMLAGMNQT